VCGVRGKRTKWRQVLEEDGNKIKRVKVRKGEIQVW